MYAKSVVLMAIKESQEGYAGKQTSLEWAFESKVSASLCCFALTRGRRAKGVAGGEGVPPSKIGFLLPLQVSRFCNFGQSESASRGYV